MIDRRRYWWVVPALGLVAAAIGIAKAAIPDGSGVIHSCFQGNNGSLRVVDDPTTCKHNETPLAWGQTGPQGPAGPRGPQGPIGPQGPSGSSHAYHVHIGAPIGTADPVASLTNLPAGNYVVWANVSVVNGGSVMTCLLKINDTTNVIPAGFTAIYSGRSTGDSGHSTMNTSVNLPFNGSSIKVFCGANIGDNGDADTDLIALKVDALN
jgi:hypothetical protein